MAFTGMVDPDSFPFVLAAGDRKVALDTEDFYPFLILFVVALVTRCLDTDNGKLSGGVTLINSAQKQSTFSPRTHLISPYDSETTETQNMNQSTEKRGL